MSKTNSMATIFVLDGSAGAREQIGECLRKGKHHVEAFGSVVELERALAGQTPALIVLEAQLPDGDELNGYGVLKKSAASR